MRYKPWFELKKRVRYLSSNFGCHRQNLLVAGFPGFHHEVWVLIWPQLFGQRRTLSCFWKIYGIRVHVSQTDTGVRKHTLNEGMLHYWKLRVSASLIYKLIVEDLLQFEQDTCNYYLRWSVIRITVATVVLSFELNTITPRALHKLMVTLPFPHSHQRFPPIIDRSLPRFTHDTRSRVMHTTTVSYARLLVWNILRCRCLM